MVPSGIHLTTGAVSSLMRGEEVEKPVFQILGFKKIAGQGGNDRYRLNISDGVHSHTFAMLATQLNHMIPDGQLDNFCVIRAEKIISNAVSEKRVLIILDVTVLNQGTDVKVKVGNPVQWNDAAAAAAGGQPRPTPRAPQPQAVRNEGSGGRLSSERNGSNYGSNQSYGNSSLSAQSGASIPIIDINPYNGSKCQIKARVTNKGPIKNWSNSRGEGKLFNMDLLDESGEIRMAGFNQSVDAFYDMLKVGNVYLIKNFQVKQANKQFSTINNDYELSFNSDTQVFPCTDAEATEIPVISFDFMEIGNIEGIEKDRTIDVIGVCKQRGELQTFTSRNTQKEFTKRDIVLVDKTNREINLTLWGKQAEDFEDDSNPVVAAKGVKVSDFNGRSLSCMNSSSFQINPDIPEAHILRGWYDNEGINLESHSLSVGRTQGGGGVTPWKLLREANSMDNVAAQEKGDYFMSKVAIVAIKRENALYKGCSEPNCNKKVVDNNNGLYRCEKCNKEMSEYNWRSMMNVNFADCSDFVWGTCFQDTAEIVLGNKMDIIGPIYNDDPEAFDLIIKEAVFKNYIVKFRSKMETYNNENRLKHSVLELHPVNFAEYAKKLLNEIKECCA